MTETFVDAAGRHARERGDALALADDRARLDWRDVASWVDAAAGWLVARAIPRGAPVIGWLPNVVEWYLLRLACERAGLLWVPVPAGQGAREFGSMYAAPEGAGSRSPTEIEGLLRTHPAVAEAVVVGVPDPVLGERVPERLVILSALPTVGDKIDRRALAALVAAPGETNAAW